MLTRLTPAWRLALVATAITAAFLALVPVAAPGLLPAMRPERSGHACWWSWGRVSMR